MRPMDRFPTSHAPVGRFLLPLLAVALSVAPAFAGAAPRGPTISEIIQTDNGDNDGFADTNETVELRLTLENTGLDDLTDVVATLLDNFKRAHLDYGFFPTRRKVENFEDLLALRARLRRPMAPLTYATLSTMGVGEEARETG